jgi:hypothetical protein
MLHIARMNGTAFFNLAATLGIFLAVSLPVAGAEFETEELSKETVEAFERYVKASEARSAEELANNKNFLWIDGLPERERKQRYGNLRRGQVVVERFVGCRLAGCAAIPGGLVHDWMAAVFVPDVTLRQTLAALQDYARDSEYYWPEVVRSKLLSRSGDRFDVYLRLKQQYVITVVLDTEYDVQYQPLDETHAASRSHSLRIEEVKDASTVREHVIKGASPHGYLWRLNSYWRFYEGDGGVYIQCNAVSLTRDIPTGLGWVVGPFIESVPQESLRFTLNATRNALLKNFHGGCR